MMNTAIIRKTAMSKMPMSNMLPLTLLRLLSVSKVVAMMHHVYPAIGCVYRYQNVCGRRCLAE